MSVNQEFRIAGLRSLEDVESAITAVNANRGYDLAIYASALDRRLGALRDAALFQALITWARLSPKAALNLLSNGPEDTDGVLAEACGYSVGIGAIALAGSIKVRGQTVSKPQALAAAVPRMSAAHEGRFEALLKGRTIDLLCVSGAERQYLKPLFSRPAASGLRDKFDLRSTVRTLASSASQCSAADIDDATVSALATLTHELFENTQEHATQDISGAAYRRHVELLSASWVELPGEGDDPDLSINPKLIAYWDDLGRRQHTRRRPAGVCFSFLDSGPGMASRLTGKEYHQLSIDEERRALQDCLRMHVTSKRDKGTGGGFASVLTQVAQAGGFVRVRSGRHSIFRCFASDAQAEVTEGFEDWFQDRALYRVAGTLISVFVPFPRPSL